MNCILIAFLSNFKKIASQLGLILLFSFFIHASIASAARQASLLAEVPWGSSSLRTGGPVALDGMPHTYLGAPSPSSYVMGGPSYGLMSPQLARSSFMEAVPAAKPSQVVQVAPYERLNNPSGAQLDIKKPIKVLSLNTHMDPWKRYNPNRVEAFTSWLKEQKADVIMLQGVFHKRERRLLDEKLAQYYDGIRIDGPSTKFHKWNGGLRIYTKKAPLYNYVPKSERRISFKGQHFINKGIVSAKFRLADGRTMSIYTLVTFFKEKPPKKVVDKQRRQLLRVANAIDQDDADVIIVGGEMNVPAERASRIFGMDQPSIHVIQSKEFPHVKEAPMGQNDYIFVKYKGIPAGQAPLIDNYRYLVTGNYRARGLELLTDHPALIAKVPIGRRISRASFPELNSSVAAAADRPQKRPIYLPESRDSHLLQQAFQTPIMKTDPIFQAGGPAVMAGPQTRI